MAQGDVTLFDYLPKSIQLGEHNLQTDDIRVAFIDNTKVAAATDEAPSFDDYTEVYGGASAPQGGKQLQNVTLVETSGSSPFDADDMEWAQDGGGLAPTTIFQAIIYNNSRSDNRCIAFIDMTADGGVTPVSLAANTISLSWNSNGIFKAYKA